MTPLRSPASPFRATWKPAWTSISGCVNMTGVLARSHAKALRRVHRQPHPRAGGKRQRRRRLAPRTSSPASPAYYTPTVTGARPCCLPSSRRFWAWAPGATGFCAASPSWWSAARAPWSSACRCRSSAASAAPASWACWSRAANYLEALAKVDTVVFDKTGTLTNGTFNVVAVHTEHDIDPDYAAELRGARGGLFGPSHRAVGQGSLSPATIDQARIDDVREEASGHGVACARCGRARGAAWATTSSWTRTAWHWHDCELTGTILHVSIDGPLRRPHRHRRRGERRRTPRPSTRLHDCRRAARRSCSPATAPRWRRAVAETAGHRRVPRPAAAGRQGRARSSACLSEEARRRASSPSWATASTMPRYSPAPTWASPWAPWARTPPSRPPTSCLWTTSPPTSRAPSAWRGKTMRIVWQNIVFALGVKLARARAGRAWASPNMWLAVFADVGVAILAILNAMRCHERGRFA